MFNLIKNCLKKSYIQLKNINNKVKLYHSCIISRNSIFEGYNNIGSKTIFDGYIGYGSYIGEKCDIKKTKIGKYCSIASGVTTAIGKHPSSVFVSTYPGFFSTKHYNKPCYVKEQKFQEYIFVDDEDKYCIVIGNDVWIGNNVTILGGITIGDGAIIATGAVVTKNVIPYSIVGGVPANEIKKRFSDEQIEKLVEIKWWEKSPKWLLENSDKFENIDIFLKEEAVK